MMFTGQVHGWHMYGEDLLGWCKRFLDTPELPQVQWLALLFCVAMLGGFVAFLLLLGLELLRPIIVNFYVYHWMH
jgi:hypothetical protein